MEYREDRNYIRYNKTKNLFLKYNELRRMEILYKIIKLRKEYKDLQKKANKHYPLICNKINETMLYAQTQDR